MLQLDKYWTVIKYWNKGIILEPLMKLFQMNYLALILMVRMPWYILIYSKRAWFGNKSWWANFDMMLVLSTRNSSKNISWTRIPYFNQQLLFRRYVTVMSNYNFRSWHLIKGIRKYHYLSYIIKWLRLPWTDSFYIQGRK